MHMRFHKGAGVDECWAWGFNEFEQVGGLQQGQRSGYTAWGRHRERGEERAQTARDPYEEGTRLALSPTLSMSPSPRSRAARAACGDDGTTRSGKALTTDYPVTEYAARQTM